MALFDDMRDKADDEREDAPEQYNEFGEHIGSHDEASSKPADPAESMDPAGDSLSPDDEAAVSEEMTTHESTDSPNAPQFREQLDDGDDQLYADDPAPKDPLARNEGYDDDVL